MFDKVNKIWYQQIVPKFKSDGFDVKVINVNGVEIPFSPSWKKVAVNLSGGADSACMTYILAKIIQDNKSNCKIDVISHIRCWSTRPWQEPIALDVFNHLKELFPTIINNRHTNFVAPELEMGVTGPIIPHKGKMRSGDQIQTDSFNAYLMFKHKFDAVFNATTHNPYTGEFLKTLSDRDKNPDNAIVSDFMIHKEHGVVFTPFSYVDKSWILSQYKYFDIMDLFNITRSCEGDFGDKNIFEVIPGLTAYKHGVKIPECGHCFWCQERNWAISTLEDKEYV